MKKILKKYIVLLTIAVMMETLLSAFFFGGESSIVNASTYTTVSTDYIADGDAYIRDGADNANSNFGTGTTFILKGDPDEGYTRKGFVSFDLADLTEPSVESALFKVYCSSGPGTATAVPLTIYGLTSGDTWTESSITWNHQPSSAGAVTVGTINVMASGWYTIDATSYVNSQLSKGQKMTFKIQDESNSGATITFNSKENQSNKPVLTVSTLKDSATVDARIDPESAIFDLAAPGDVSFNIAWNIASSVTGVVYDGNYVATPDGYVVTGSALTIKSGYLAALGLANGNKAEFTISFDKGNPVIFAVNIIDGAAPVSHSIKVKSGGLGGASANVNSALRGTQITLTTTPMTGANFKEWKVISPAGLDITGNTFTMPDEAVTVEAVFGGSPTVNPPLAKVLGGYWTYWAPSAIRVRDIDPDYNLIYLFHAQPVGGAPGTTGAVYWTAPGNGRGAATHLVEDIQYARNVQGRKAILTVGGAHAGITFDNRERSQNFIDSIVNIYDQLGGFDGIDWNNYEGSTSASTDEMIWISLELKRMFPGFMITTPPAPWRAADLVFCTAMVQAGALDYAAPQYYDGPGLDVPAFVVTNLDKWATALGAEHVAVGFGVSDAANYMAVDEVVTTWNQLKAKYPTLRGAFDWEIRTDESRGWEFAHALKPILSSGHNITVEIEGQGAARADVDSAVYGEEVTLTAMPEVGYIFKEWKVISPTGLDITGNTFTMPDEAVTVKAIFEEKPIAKYTLTVNGSYAAESGAGNYPEGAVVTINAGNRSNYTFWGWSSNDGVTFTDINNPTAAFNMPAKNVTVTAVWKSLTSNGDSTGNSGSGSPSIPVTNSIPTTNSIPATKDYTAVIKGMDASDNSTKDTNLRITVDAKTGTAVLDTASTSNLVTNGGTSIITVPSIPDVITYTMGIPVSYLSTADRQGALTVNTVNGSITVPSNMLTGTIGAAGAKVEISISQDDKSLLPEAAKTVIGERPLIKLSMSIDGKQLEWNNPDAPVTVSIPYTPTAAELVNSEGIIIWYIDGSGKAMAIPNGHYDPTAGTVTFTTTHFSYYAVGYNTVSFADVAAIAWYNKAVSFVVARGITTGTGNGNYSPNAKLTRGEFLVMLMRAYEIAPDENQLNNFIDAGSTYYTGYLAAAKSLGIAKGTGNNRFAPNREITRQEMFTLLYNALNAFNKLPHGNSGKTLSSFSDAEQIASWAKEAMELLVETGAIEGSAGQLTPASTTTRAEMAQVLYNLLSK